MSDKSIKEQAFLYGQECLEKFPVVILGSGSSVPYGLPNMSDLANHLIASSPTENFNNNDKVKWGSFISELKNGASLESCLDSSMISTAMHDHIVNYTWNLMCQADVKAFNEIIKNDGYMPLSRLYSHLLNSTNPTLSVVTTNYDRLAEYAADFAGFDHYTGFTNGYYRKPQSRTNFQNKRYRTINIWKVHGCLDWFINNDEEIIALTASKTIPTSYNPVIITPGTRKYELALQEPNRTILAESDMVLKKANSYLCFGYGFNDKHIQPKLFQRWQSGEANLVILAKSLSDTAINLLEKSKNNTFLALEKSSDGTIMRSHVFPEGIMLNIEGLWSLDGFLKYTVGG